MRKRIVVALLLAFGAAVAVAGDEKPKPLAIDRVIGHDIELNREISVIVVNLEEAKADPAKFTLFLGGYPLPALKASRDGKDVLRFSLERAPESATDADRAATLKSWNALLGAPSARRKTEMPVMLRYDGVIVPPADPKKPPTVTLIVVRGFVLWFWIIIFGAVFILFIIAAKTTNLLRDTVPPKPQSGKRPYSLARTQMAWWFLIILGSYIFIFAVTHDWKVMNEDALILMGIGTGTALGATLIEVTKKASGESSIATLNAEVSKQTAAIVENQKLVDALNAAPPNPLTADSIAALLTAQNAVADAKAKKAEADEALKTATAAVSAPVSVNFFNDILTDETGASVHRFQMVAWTIVIGIIYVYGVWKSLALPDLNAALEALLGISSGAYLGFKIPEKQS